MSDKETFELTDKHLVLLKNAFINWDDCEVGAPCIDPKRPYGNSNVPVDIHEMLTGEEFPDSEDDYDLVSELEEKYMNLHRETQIALQIILSTMSFRTGLYEKQDKYDSTSWKYLG